MLAARKRECRRPAPLPCATEIARHHRCCNISQGRGRRCCCREQRNPSPSRRSCRSLPQSSPVAVAVEGERGVETRPIPPLPSLVHGGNNEKLHEKESQGGRRSSMPSSTAAALPRRKQWKMASTDVAVVLRERYERDGEGWLLHAVVSRR
nr:hypothetical protein Iba_chr07cCG7260 [Ipomoea batatas]